MPRSASTSRASQNVRKTQILTQSAPSRLGHTDARVVKSGEVFMLSARDGDVPWKLPHAYGLFLADCRFLNGLEVRLNGSAPEPLLADDSRGHTATFALVNAPFDGADGRVEQHAIGIWRERSIRGAVVRETIRLENHDTRTVDLRLTIRARCSFEDLFQVKGFIRRRGVTRMPEIYTHGCIWRHTDRAGITRETHMAFHPAPSGWEGEAVVFDLRLEHGATCTVTTTITPTIGDGTREDQPAHASGTRNGKQEKAERIWLATNTRIATSDEVLDRVLERALLDLRLLRSNIGGLHYFAAGVPWFVTLFGRDSIITAIQTLPYGAETARQTLSLLARYQAHHHDAYRDADPGKILHELRRGELAQTGEIPQSPVYYGTVDATVLFVILMAEYVRWTGDLDHVRTLAGPLDAALEWMERYADADGDGYLDYTGGDERGLINQGWKDSGNAIVNRDGSLARPPIALCEVQGYAFRAWQAEAWLRQQLGDRARADAAERRAEDMRARFNRDFWSEDLGCYVLARQRDGEPVATVASNTGQVLWSGIAPADRARRVVDRLMAPDMYSGWGIRTLSSDAVRFNPISYQLGSVWPHDNALILAGFRRYAHDEAARRIFDGLFEAAAAMKNGRLPELFCGHSRRVATRPVPYPVASSPQAWAAGALPYALWNLLGLDADAPAGVLRIVRPLLPSQVERVELSALRVGGALVNLRFSAEPHGGAVHVESEVTQGDLHVSVES